MGTTARLSTPRLSPLPTLLPTPLPLPVPLSTLPPLSTLLPTPLPLPVPLSTLPPLSTLLPALWSTPLPLSTLPCTLPPFTVEPVRFPTAPCPRLTRERTGRPPSPRPSEPPLPPSTTHPALSMELTAGGDLPLLDTELSSVKKLKQSIMRTTITEDIRRLDRLLTHQAKL